MKPLSSKDFNAFFVALYGFEPLPWQQNLLELVVNSQDSGSWPEALTLPTASGKTAILAIAVFALACQADRPCHQRSAPRRIFFVVDRRIIVDEAFSMAKHMAENLRKAPSDIPEILKKVADRLMLLAGGKDFAEKPLAVFQLRGGIYRDDAWARTPLQPTIITSTVDQIGSRLFYRGYGVSRFSRPIHAGLAANDSLIILDEAHCSTPFYQSVRAIRKYRAWAERRIRNPFAFVIMSATPPPGIKGNTFGLQEEDREHPVLKRRLNAKKPARLIDATKAKTRSEFAEIAATAALDLSTSCMATAVIVNRVASAKAIYDRLMVIGYVDTILLTGRMRPVDRDLSIRAWTPFLKTGSAIRNNISKPMIVVSTQCLEVGADLDFDGLVTECAAFDALCQRFGRLNRGGRDIDSKAIIIWWPGPQNADKCASERGTATPVKGSDDPVYGPALKKTWKFLKTQQRGRGKDKVIQMGIEDVKLMQEQHQEDLAECCSPSPNAPILFPAHLDLLAQTDPAPCPDPDIALFLHGCGRGQMDVQVCWRADISSGSQDQQKWIDAVGLCPPTSAECMSVPLYVLRDWLNQTVDEILDSSDVVGSLLKDSSDDIGVANRRTLCWRGPEDSFLINRPFDIKPGDTVVIPVDLKGWDSLGFIPETQTAKSQVDVGDAANFQTRALPVLRLFPDLVRAWS
ncbi:MAG: type I-U CRISPR-associated helicase/endonuclease Cas3, partial [Desulfomonilaceae bacterium]